MTDTDAPTRPDTAVSRRAPLARDSLGQQAYHRLRLDLMEGRFQPGEKLKLRDLARELGVSPTPVREALARLVSEMALAQVDHRSVRVPHMDPERFIEIRDLRVELEGRAAARAAERASDAEIDALEGVQARLIALKNAREVKRSLVENQRFHAGLCAMANMPVLFHMLESLWLQIGPLMNALLVRRPTTLPKRHPHRIILEGLRRRDPQLTRHGVQEDIFLNTEPLLQFLSNEASPP